MTAPKPPAALHVIPDDDQELFRAAVEYATGQDHDPEHPLFQQLVDLRAGSEVLRNAVAYAAGRARRDAERWRLEAHRSKRINVIGMNYASQINPQAGPGHVAAGLGNLRLLLGDNRASATTEDPYLVGLDRIIAETTAQPAGETP